jgi:chromosome segregation ATPase
MYGSAGNERGSDKVVLATYREIAERFGLHSGPDAGRMRAKRGGWPHEPQNHPMDPVRVRVPREAWDEPGRARSYGNKGADSRERSRGNKTEQGAGDLAELREALARQEATTEALRSSTARLEVERAGLLEDASQARQEAREARALAERRGEEVAELRERLARQEALQPLVERLQADRDAVTAKLASVYQEAQEARQMADGRAVELADTRERAGRAEGEAEGLRAALRTAEAQTASLQADVARERATAQALLQAEAAERQVAEEARAELAAWRQGGPLTRALRAFFRRGL